MISGPAQGIVGEAGLLPLEPILIRNLDSEFGSTKVIKSGSTTLELNPNL
jgi:hypothetical protein